MKSILVLVGLTLLTGCQSASSGVPKPISAGSLVEEYERSINSARRKYDGKEITVKGYVLNTVIAANDGNDQSSVLLEERDRDLGRQVVCWFSKEQAERFRKIKRGQYITVKGVFNGESGMDLKFCKLVETG